MHLTCFISWEAGLPIHLSKALTALSVRAQSVCDQWRSNSLRIIFDSSVTCYPANNSVFPRLSGVTLLSSHSWHFTHLLSASTGLFLPPRGSWYGSLSFSGQQIHQRDTILDSKIHLELELRFFFWCKCFTCTNSITMGSYQKWLQEFTVLYRWSLFLPTSGIWTDRVTYSAQQNRDTCDAGRGWKRACPFSSWNPNTTGRSQPAGWDSCGPVTQDAFADNRPRECLTDKAVWHQNNCPAK